MWPASFCEQSSPPAQQPRLERCPHVRKSSQNLPPREGRHYYARIIISPIFIKCNSATAYPIHPVSQPLQLKRVPPCGKTWWEPRHSYCCTTILCLTVTAPAPPSCFAENSIVKPDHSSNFYSHNILKHHNSFLFTIVPRYFEGWTIQSKKQS